MAPWVRKTFVDILPKYLFIQRPDREEEEEEDFFSKDVEEKTDPDNSLLFFNENDRYNYIISPILTNMGNNR